MIAGARRKNKRTRGSVEGGSNGKFIGFRGERPVSFFSRFFVPFLFVKCIVFRRGLLFYRGLRVNSYGRYGSSTSNLFCLLQ